MTRRIASRAGMMRGSSADPGATSAIDAEPSNTTMASAVHSGVACAMSDAIKAADSASPIAGFAMLISVLCVLGTELWRVLSLSSWRTD